MNYLKHLGCVNSDSQAKERTTVINKVQKLMKTLISFADVDQAADKLGRKFMYDSMPPVLAKKEVGHTSRLDGDFMKDGKIYNRLLVIVGIYFAIFFITVILGLRLEWIRKCACCGTTVSV